MVSPEVSLVLHKANGGEEIVEACNYAIRIISEENTFDENDPCVIHELENIASALMRILITSYNDASTLCKATETVQTLVLKCPLLKRQLAVKGLYTSIMNLGATTIKPHIHQPPINDQTTLFACVMRLLVCLTEDCIENIYQCKQQDIMALIKHCFTEFETIKELMEMTVRLLALLVTDDLFRGIGPTSKVAKDFSSYQKEWRDELCKTRVSTLPIEHFILTLMNRYLADDKNIQMESIKLLNILSQTEGSLDGIRSFGGVDSTLHAIEHYMGCDIILKQGLKLALRLIDGIQYSEVMEIKKDAVFSLMSKVLFANDKKINLEDESFYYLCEIFLVSIENNRNLDTCIVGLSSIFHRLFEKALHAYSHESGDEDWMKEKFSSVAKFLLKVLFFKDFRNRLLIEACKNAHTSLALFLICTGADCNFTYDLQSTTALTAACETNHTTLVCTILALLTNQHNDGTTSKKIKNIETCIRLSLINGNDSITSALLRFLVWSNTNETVDWKKLKLTRIKPDWIATAFCQKVGVEEVQTASLIRNVLTFSMYICTFYGKGKGLVSALEGTSAAFERSMKSEQTWKSTNDLFKVSPVKEIKVLDFSYNEMTELSFIEEINEDVRKCFSSIVEVVNLSNNNLPHAPIEHFKVFKSITVLNLSKNCLSKFPAQVIFNCECLRKLDLSENQIKNIEFGEDIISRSGRYSPENYLQHNNLEMINLQHNCLTLFPLQNLCCFPMLAELNISHNKIVDFGSFTYDSTSLKHMQKLNLSHNCLGKFYPICVEKMFPNLEILSLSQNCSIEFMGNSVLSTNSITTLKLGNCNIETIPIFIQYLPNLEILHLQENSLVNINCLILWRSSKLMEFDLCGNHLNDINVMIDHMITKYCSSMKNLNLSKNYINFLPSKIGNLQFLEELDVTGNIITSIPCEVGKLKCLISLKFDHDKCNGQWKGTAKKTRHFLYNQMKNSVHDYQVSVIFCGERNSGKTTLIQSLIKANMGVFHKEESASRESENFRKTKSYKFCIKHHKSGRCITL